jgi:hypothetical protein
MRRLGKVVYTELGETIYCYLRDGTGAMVGGAGAVVADLLPANLFRNFEA